MDATSRHIPIRESWLATTIEAAIDPETPIVDAHHHLWHKQDAPSYLLPQMQADIASSGHNIVATVAVEARHNYRDDLGPALAPLGETEQAVGVGTTCRDTDPDGPAIAAAIVGYVDLSLGAEAGALLDRHIEVAQGRFRGVRNTSAWHADPAARGSVILPPPGLLYDRKFRQGIKELTRRNLVFEAWMYHTQLGELVDLARDNPETRIVLNHQGGPIGFGPYAGCRAEVFRDWTHFMRRLAEYPNIRVKLGGMGMLMAGFRFHENARAPTSAELAAAWSPYMTSCIELFGAQRCMFESNFPVDKGTASYGVVWNAFKRIIHAYSADEKRDLLGRNARDLYSLTIDI
ncbi:amidohydrolase family protein [Bordetella genomosp. 12]|nr:amidohydrolase family protein [Bordetella genomosp. 12]